MLKLGYDRKTVNLLGRKIRKFNDGSEDRVFTRLYKPKSYKDTQQLGKRFWKGFGPMINQLHPEVTAMEKKEFLKYHSFSQRLPYSKIDKTFISTLTSIGSVKGQVYLEKAYHAINKRYFRSYLGRCSPISPERRASLLPKDSQWGLPHLRKGKYCLPEHLAIAKGFLRKGFVNFVPSVFGMRNQPGAFDTPKLRIILLVCHGITIVETCFSRVLTRIYKNIPCFYKIQSQDKCDSRVTTIINKSVADSWPLMSIDFSTFGFSIDSIIIGYFGRHVKAMFGIKPSSHYSGLVDSLISNLHSGCILMPDNTFLFRRRGISDGSRFTSICGSYCHLLLFYATFFFLYDRSPDDDVLSIHLGDDGLWYWYGIVIDDVVKVLSDQFNITVSISKSMYKVGVRIFCSNLYLSDYRPDPRRPFLCRGIRSIARTLVGNQYSEHRKYIGSSGLKWSPVDDTIRWFVQLENIKWHPLRFNFLKFIAKGDFVFNLGLRMRLGVPGVFKIIGGFDVFLKSSLSSDFKYSRSVYSSRLGDLWITQAVDALLSNRLSNTL
jgi:hypothetical protein